VLAALAVSCSAAASKNGISNTAEVTNTAENSSETTKPKAAAIEITAGGPADTVRAFYKLLREKKFRDALFLTNLRPAIESLSDSELNDFALDFEAIAGLIPAELQINGEIVSGDSATVTALLPNDETGKDELQQIKLKKNGETWTIITVDDEAEKRIKAEGKQYFYNLRVETHENEASSMMERIAKAEVAFSLQNDNVCGDLPTLIQGGLLPADAGSSASTGYNYTITLSADKHRYFANAVPAEYGRTGRRSFLLEIDEKGLPHISSKDLKGEPIKK